MELLQNCSVIRIREDALKHAVIKAKKKALSSLLCL